MAMTQLSTDSPANGRKGRDSRNPTPSGRRIRDKTPLRIRDTTPIKIRQKTPVKRGATPKTNGDKNRSKTPVKMSSKSTKKKQDEDVTPASRSRNTTPVRPSQKIRDKTPTRRMSPLHTKKGTSIKVRPKTHEKEKGRGLFKKGKKKGSELPPRPSDSESSREENSPNHEPVNFQEKLPTPPTQSESVAKEPKKKNDETTKKNKNKKKTKRSKSPAVKKRQPKEKETIDAADPQCGGNPFLKTADDAVLGIGYYFGKGIVAIVDGVKDGTMGCAQTVKAQAPTTKAVDKFTCRAPSFDTGYTGYTAGTSYDSQSEATSKYLYDDEGNRVDRDSIF